MTINIKMEKKYTPKPKGKRKKRSNPDLWMSGPTDLDRELFYSWHKHRAQCNFRHEPYELTYENWREIWSNPDDFLNRGRGPNNVILTRRDPSGAWSLDNCEIVIRINYLRKNAQRQLRGSRGSFR